MSSTYQKGSTHVRVLEGFGGLDLSGSIDTTTPRFSRLDNMWRDYRAGDGDALESFPGFRSLTTLPGAVHGIWHWQSGGTERLAVHAGKSLYVWDFSETDGTALTNPLSPVTGGDGVLNDARSHAFSVGEELYLLDGEGYYVLSDKGGTHLLPVRNLYTPITYSDGEPYEQRNLLSDYAVNRYHISDPSAYTYGSDGLRYRILSEEERTCEVAGYQGKHTEEVLYIPAQTVIGNKNYRVVRVGWKAFAQQYQLKELYVSEGVEEIAMVAFGLCRGLVRIYLPDSLRVLRRSAFRDTTSLQSAVLGHSLSEIEMTVFKNSTLTEIIYHGDAEEYAAIVRSDDNEELNAAKVTYVDQYPVQVCRFFLYEKAESVCGVTLDGISVPPGTGSPHYTVEYTGDGYVKGVVLHGDTAYDLTGRELQIEIKLDDTYPGSVPDETDFAAASNGYDGTTHAALARCRVAAAYDGRIFFTGNPSLPATVFYCARDLSGHQNPAYVGVYNYFMCGDESTPNTALLPTASYLAVLKGKNRSSGTVTYYRGCDTGRNLVPRIYCAADSIVGQSCAGVAVNFRDDPVFLSYEGLEAAGREALNTERSLAHRSTLIDAALTARDPETALAAVWEGYLVLLYPDGEAYLADSRRTCRTLRGQEYEWYHLCGVGTYTADVPVFRYADAYRSAEPEKTDFSGEVRELSLHPEADGLPYGADDAAYPSVYPAIRAGVNLAGEEVYYSVETSATGEKLYLLHRTPERAGGVFSPPTAIGVCRDKLLFGCENGTLCVVNTDRRGVMNDMQSAAYTPESYARQWGNVINPEWYSYCGHRFTSGLATAYDDCGVPNYTKGTLRGTTVLEMKAGFGLGFSVEVRELRAGSPEGGEVLRTQNGGLDFALLDFGQINFGVAENNTVTLQERSRRWLRKQYCLFSDTFAQPFGLRRLSYTWRIEGKVKNA